jgi:hypothetical protein
VTLTNWHGGKLVLVWAVVAAALFIGVKIESDIVAATAVVAGAASVVATWKWLSARENRGVSRPLRQPGAETISERARAIARAITDATPDERGAVRGLVELVPIDNKQLGWEIIGLRRAAAFLVVAGELSRSPQQAADLMARVDTTILVELADASALEPLEKRRGEYLAAMSVLMNNETSLRLPPGAETLDYSHETVANAGKLFAFIVGAERSPLVAGVGSTMFAATMRSVQAALH